MLLHRDESLDIAYAPYLTKCGSTTMKDILNDLSNHTMYYVNRPPVSDEILRQYTFLSFLRHPIDRALSGYHQLERVLRLGYLDKMIEKYNLRWWNTSCIDSPYGLSTTKKQKYECTATRPSKTLSARLSRLNAFLDELIRLGSFDQHTAPLTMLMQRNPVKRVVPNTRSFYFNLDDITAVHQALSRHYNRPYTPVGPKMSRSESLIAQQYTWIVTWKELLDEANITSSTFTSSSRHTSNNPPSLAGTVLQKLCEFYRHDVECLPFEVPECRPYYHTLN